MKHDREEQKKILTSDPVCQEGSISVSRVLLILSATLAGFDHHVGELLDSRRAADEVHDGEGLQVLRDAAGGGGGLRVQLVV